MADDIPSTGDSIAVGDLSDLADGDMRCFPDVGDYGIVVCRYQGSLYALEDNCSHADTPLSEGRFRGAKVTCPLHGAQFDVRDGTHSGPPAFEGVACYQVVESSDGVVVMLDSGGKESSDGFGEIGGRFRTR